MPKCIPEAEVSPLVLAFPKHFILHTDACKEGLGAILKRVQDDGHLHHIAYASRSLNRHKQNYWTTDMEVLIDVVWAAKHFRAYLNGHQCTEFTDHAPLRALFTRWENQPVGLMSCQSLIWISATSQGERILMQTPYQEHLC